MGYVMTLSLESRAVMAIDSIYSTARICGSTSALINAAKIHAMAALPKRTPHYVRAYADGYERALRNDLYANCLVFGGWINGQFYSTDCQRDDYYAKRGIDPAEWHKLASDKGHYWRHNLNPYFVGEE